MLSKLVFPLLALIAVDVPFEDSFETEFFNDEMIALQDDREDLLKYIYAFSEKDYVVFETQDVRMYVSKDSSLKERPDLEMLFEKYVKQGSTVVDYGAGNGVCTLAFARLIGLGGNLIAFESQPVHFRELFWNLKLNNEQNAKLYCKTLGEKGNTLDALKLKNVSFIRVYAHGYEDLFLIGAQKTIQAFKPVLLLQMIGGIPIERADKYVKQVFHHRMEKIHKMGYVVERISDCEYLALPN